jgi:hypothetical protein
MVVTLAASEDSATNLSISGGGLAYTLKGSITASGHCEAYGWTALPASTGALTTAVANSGGGTRFFGQGTTVLSGSDGIGATATSSTAQSVTLTTTQDNSAILVVISDWSAGNWGTTRPWTTINGAAGTELTYFRDTVRYTTGRAYWADAGPAGAKTVGLSGLSGTWSVVAIEIKGTASSGESHSGSAALSGSGVLSVAAAVGLAGIVALSGLGSLAATGTPSVARAAALSGAGSLTTSGTPAVTRAAALSGSGSLTATGSATQAGSGSATLSGSGSLTAAATPATSGAASLSGTGTLAASGSSSETATGTAALSGTGSLVASGTPTPHGAAALTGNGTLTATGVASQPGSGSANLTGAGTLTAGGAPTASVAVTLTGAGNLTATGLPTLPGFATLTGEGTLTASGVNPGAFRDVTVLSVTEVTRPFTATEVVRPFTATEAARQLTITGGPMYLKRIARGYYSLAIVTDPAVASWEASFDGGDSFVAGEVDGANTRWLLAGPDADPGTATVIAATVTPSVRATDTPEVILRDTPRVWLIA